MLPQQPLSIGTQMYALSIYLPNFEADIFQLKSNTSVWYLLNFISSFILLYNAYLVKRLQIYNLILNFQMFFEKIETFFKKNETFLLFETYFPLLPSFSNLHSLLLGHKLLENQVLSSYLMPSHYVLLFGKI